MPRALLLLPLCTAIAACAATPSFSNNAAPATSSGPESEAVNLAGATAAGAPQDCVQLHDIRETRVIDDRTIDFHMNNGRVLRNMLPQRCPQLGFEKAFSYSTSLSQLCRVDSIRVVIQSGGPLLGAACGLGRFQPVTLAHK